MLGWEHGGAADTMVLGQGEICCQESLHRRRVDQTSVARVDSGLFRIKVSSATKSGNTGRLFLTVIGSGSRKNPENRDGF